MPGPPPKRTEQRRRRNKPEAGQEVTTAAGSGLVKAPNVKPGWHPIMKDWYRSLKSSGQAQFYQASDWQTAQLWCHIMSEALSDDEPIKAALLAQFNSAAGDLMTTEGARRRLRLELQNPDGANGADDDATVSIMEHYRQKLQ